MPRKRTIAFLAVLVCTLSACAGSVYMPGKPGGGGSDVSGPDVRESWLAANPDTPEPIASAIREGIFVAGMTVDHRDVVTNPRREGTTANGFWRSRTTGDQVRYRWYVANEQMPFTDGQARLVCELVFAEGLLQDVRYCSGSGAAPRADPP